MLISNMSYNLNQSLNRMEKLQFQSTGKKFRVPSDDPIGSSKALRLRTDLAKIGQYTRNVDDARSWMKETELAMEEINEILHRANELTNQAATETYSEDDLIKMKQEFTEMKDAVIQIANTSYGGRSIFTGYKTEEKLLDDDGNYLINLFPDRFDYLDESNPSNIEEKSGKIIYENGAYKVMGESGLEIGTYENGEISLASDYKLKKVYDGRVEYRTGQEETVSVNTLGYNIFGTVKKTGDGETGLEKHREPDYKTPAVQGEKAYVIKLFDELEEALSNRDTKRLEDGLKDIQDTRANILSEVSKVGAKVNRVNITSEKLEDQNLNMRDLLSQVEDVSIPETYMKLMLEKNVYNASLSIGAQIIQPSLADFIR